MTNGTRPETDPRRSDRLLACKQLETLADALSADGRPLAAAIIDAAAAHMAALVAEVERLEAELASSFRPPVAVSCMKHRYGMDDICTKCGADRQRKRSNKAAGLLRAAVERGVREGVTDSATIVEDGAAS